MSSSDHADTVKATSVHKTSESTGGTTAPGSNIKGALPTKNFPSGAAAGSAPKALDEDGAIGKQFTENGALGGIAQKIGGPLDKDGVIGKQFTTEGSIGGTVQSALGGKKEV